MVPAYEGVRTEMEQASQSHKKIASNIRELVVQPFGRWCEAHAARVQNSQDDLQARIKVHDKQAEAVRKFRSQYYNKCRLVEDLEEEDKLAFQDPRNEAQSPKNTPTVKISEPEDAEDEPIEIGDDTYPPDQMKKILTHMLENIKLGEYKLPIIGTYQNVASGADITDYIQNHMGATSVSYAERIGQDLCSHGFLRLLGNVGSTFANSSKMNYQFRPKVFQITGIPDKKKPLERVSSVMSSDSNTADSPSSAVGEFLSGWNPMNTARPGETPSERLRREAHEADERYKAAVKKLDFLRCNLEESMVDHLKFMERCELDRLKAVKAVILDFSGAISNVMPTLQSTIDKMMLFQETVQPLGDLRYLLENYHTGHFVPKVVTYENYYNNVDEQTFGVDLEARARSDRKRVPIIVTSILTFLDNRKRNAHTSPSTAEMLI
ncbi:Rho-GTPase-activating protein 8 [Diplodia seriata]|uniref:Rho-GTPase-activating protein 8 n=1 Tax=Diplodia seriata TaxID=420778 RepID=A0ABR3CCL3_9PEZI